MIYTETITDLALEAILEQIGERIPNLVDQIPSSIHLMETLPLWFITSSDIKPESAELLNLAKPTNYWHHQISFDRTAKAYARSTFDRDSEKWILCELFISRLAQKIEEAIYLLDEEMVKEPTARLLIRLLVAPEYQIHALWVINESNNESEVLIADSPAELEDIQPNRSYSSKAFLSNLSHHHSVAGISYG